LPICQIPAEVKDTQVRESLLTVFENILLRQLNISGQMITVFKYLIGEAMDNIVDHSGVQNGWIMVQNYPQKGFLDVCILETGIGLLGSYQKFDFQDIKTDAQALEQAINGKSTKQITETRGYGIDTSRRMLVNGLNGKYFLLSGSAMYIYTNDFEQIVPLTRHIAWSGTMLALRIPQTVPAGFYYSNYLE
jgi:anti-sigma regulatory factor (Ser/Thr protein kinase)